MWIPSRPRVGRADRWSTWDRSGRLALDHESNQSAPRRPLVDRMGPGWMPDRPPANRDRPWIDRWSARSTPCQSHADRRSAASTRDLVRVGRWSTAGRPGRPDSAPGRPCSARARAAVDWVAPGSTAWCPARVPPAPLPPSVQQMPKVRRVSQQGVQRGPVVRRGRSAVDLGVDRLSILERPLLDPSTGA